MMELKGKRVMVIGLGVSGLAAARLLAARGAALVMAERAPISRARIAGGANCIWVQRIRRGLTASILVVASPGCAADVASDGPRGDARGIPLIGELELGSRFRSRADRRGHRHQRQEYGDGIDRRDLPRGGYKRPLSAAISARPLADAVEGELRRRRGRGFELSTRIDRDLQTDGRDSSEPYR